MQRLRKGITPVVAIILLLMMTIAAAGAAYTWIQSVIEQQKDEANCQLQSSIEAASVECFPDTNKMRVALINTGKRPLDVVPTTILAKEGGQQLKLQGNQLRSGSINNESAWREAQRPGGVSPPTNITLTNSRGDVFQKGMYYQVEIKFPEDQCAPSIRTDCTP